MAKAVTLYNTSNEEVYPVTDASLVNGEIARSQIANEAVNKDKVDPDFLDASGSYLSSEVETPFTWVDGKVIYKKTIYAGNLPNASVKTVDHGISNIDIVVKMDAFAKDSVAFTPLPFPGTASNPAGFIQVAITPTAISIGTGTNRSSATAYITLYYTKSS